MAELIDCRCDRWPEVPCSNKADGEDFRCSICRPGDCSTVTMPAELAAHAVTDDQNRAHVRAWFTQEREPDDPIPDPPWLATVRRRQ
jgi:hypothetical protein